MTQNNHAISTYTLSNDHGTKVKITNLGATLLDVIVNIKSTNEQRSLILGTTLDNYSKQHVYMGATIGRFANRIANSSFSIDDIEYKITPRPCDVERTAAHCPVHTLHGGAHGFDKRLFELSMLTPNSITLTTLSKDGDQGFPGDVNLAVTYTLTNENELKIEYFATSTKKTPVNITNHAYWNLNGEANNPNASNNGHIVKINTDTYLPVKPDGIPTGEFKSVENSVFNLQEPTEITSELLANDALKDTKGFDHPYVFRTHTTSKPIITCESKDSLVQMIIKTNYPACHFYSANYFKGTPSRNENQTYEDYSSLAFEPEFYPNFVNQDEFKLDCPLVEPNKPLKKFICFKFIVK